MRWASALSQEARLEDAVVETARSIREALGEVGPDLVAAFVSAHHRPAYVRLGELLRRELPGSLVLGCTAFGVIGAGHEVEGEPALSLTAASLPGVTLEPFRVEQLPAGTPEELRRAFGIRAARPHLLLLADPLTLDAQAFAQAARACGVRPATGASWDDLFTQVLLERIEPARQPITGENPRSGSASRKPSSRPEWTGASSKPFAAAGPGTGRAAACPGANSPTGPNA